MAAFQVVDAVAVIANGVLRGCGRQKIGVIINLVGMPPGCRGGLQCNQAVYTATPVVGGWAGAVMSWVRALISIKYSYLNLSSL